MNNLAVEKDHDYVTIRDGAAEGNVLATLTGRHETVSYTSTQNSLTVKFTSDSKGNWVATGISISYEISQ